MNCPYCGSSETQTVYQAAMPNLLAACPPEMLDDVKIYPFEVQLCPACKLGFNSKRLDDAELTKIYDNYLYISPSQGIGYSTFRGILELIQRCFGKDQNLVEIASSDGYLLNQLTNAGFSDLTGVEPGPQADAARASGLNVIKDYFDVNMFASKSVGGFILRHVFEHFTDPFSIFKAMQEQLSPDGRIVIEVPDFGGYHHQHLFFYSAEFFKRLCADCGMELLHASTGGGNLWVVIGHQPAAVDGLTIDPAAFYDILAKAQRDYDSFQQTLLKINRILEQRSGQRVYWWGAGSGSVNYLCQIDEQLMRAVDLRIVDGDKNKWGCYMPGNRILVAPYTDIAGETIDCIIIASMFREEIAETMAKNGITAKQIEYLY